jgi:FtsH-binding integral membrane protein
MGIRDDALDALCSQREQLPLLMAVVIVMGLLLVFPFLFLQAGTASYVIAVVDAILVVGSLVVFGSAYWYCTRREME